MTLARQIAPAISNRFDFSLIEPVKSIHKDVPFYFIGDNSPELVRIDVIFKAGSLHQTKHLIASTVNEMLGEGTESYSSAEINAKLDAYGAYVIKGVTSDYATVTLFSLVRYFNDVMPIFKEYITASVFPEEELAINLNNRKEALLHNLKKVDFVCRKEFSKLLYGDHPYGQSASPEDFALVKREDLLPFYTSFYQRGPDLITVSGNTSQAVIRTVESAWSDWPTRQEPLPSTPALPSYTPTQKELVFRNAIQSAIRIGCPVINQHHEDYAILSLGNIILGGYFGSRLMKNIREEKGYTYGIGSSIISTLLTGTFVISTETGTEYLPMLRDEVYKEFNQLQKEPIGEEELRLVKNYIAGHFLKSMDGYFAQADHINALITNNLPLDYYSTYLQTIEKARPEQIQACLQTHLSTDRLSEYIIKGVHV
ncbi:MAG: insulinase family protein [Flavobacteriales bacterium]|nr:insulinase family protein [Flavobacteriales bacterium]